MTSSNETSFDAGAAEQLRASVGEYLEGGVDGRGLRIGIVAGRFNGGITTRLLQGALAALDQCGVARSDITLAWAPGAFEVPLVSQALSTGPRARDAVITLGAVIRGDTGHYEFVAGECARGVQAVQLATGVPIIFGVLTTNTIEQALERSRDDRTNKGRECALGAVEMAGLLRQGSLAR